VELLESLNQEFGIEIDKESESLETWTLHLKKFLLQDLSRGGNAVLLIDEAQNLTQTVLQQILNLTELQVGEERLLQIILMGQPELKDNLVDPLLNNFDEHIALRYELKTLELEDIQGYIEHRLEVAGNNTNVIFSNGVFKEIYDYSLGNPRRINAICDRLLLIAYVEGEHTVTERMTEKAVGELHGDFPAPPVGEWSLLSLKRGLLFFILPLVVVIFSGWALRNQVMGIFSDEQKPASFTLANPLNPLVGKNPRGESSISASPEQGQAQKHEAKPATLKPKSLPLNPALEPETVPAADTEEETFTHYSTDKPTFSVQVGAFQVEANARNLLTELKQKGYDPIIVSILDYGDSLWHSVRIQDNSASEEAYKAASNYREREGKPAIVTKTGSLDPFSP
jgi:general secretion pathway protein A